MKELVAAILNPVPLSEFADLVTTVHPRFRQRLNFLEQEMAKTVDEAFEILVERLKPSESETTAAATHRAGIESRLKSDFEMTRMFRSGSFGHGTSVKGHSDIDYFAVLPGAKLAKSSNYTLQRIRESLLRRFPNTNIIISSPAVVVPFGSTSSERHEITPAWVDAMKDGNTLYGIPNRADVRVWSRACA